ncbi:MAG: hypothetical protein CMJ62_00740 [Planctomycetaceae bacterium]|nr:hypothetical protein [Planctomycetaceae bacterium]
MRTSVAQVALRGSHLPGALEGVGLGRLAMALFSFETLFLLYIFAGRFKSDPRLAFVPVDLTVFFLCLGMLAGVLIVLRRGYVLPPTSPRFLWAAGLFFAYVMLSYLWSSSFEYGRDKCLFIGVLTTYPLVACALVISSSRRRLIRFLCLLIVFAFSISMSRLISISRHGVFSSEYVLGGNYLDTGGVAGMASLTCLVFGLKCASTGWQRNLFYLGVGYFSLVLLMVGGRGPCLATAASAAVIPLLGARQRWRESARYRRRGSVIAMLLLAIGTAYFCWDYVGDQRELSTIRRLEMLVNGNDFGGSAETRLDMWRVCFQVWPEKPVFGHGLGSFAVLYQNIDERLFPHNLFLELVVETGVVGLVLLMLLLLVAFRNLVSQRRLSDDPLRVLVFALLVNTFLQVMVSGDIPDNREFFGLLGLTCLVYRKVYSDEKNRAPYVGAPTL